MMKRYGISFNFEKNINIGRDWIYAFVAKMAKFLNIHKNGGLTQESFVDI